MIPVLEGVILVPVESKVHKTLEEEQVHLLSGFPQGWWTVGPSMEDFLMEFLQGIEQEVSQQDCRQFEQQSRELQQCIRQR